MSTVLDFQTELGPFSIQLLDTAVVDLWFKHFCKISKHYKLSSLWVCWPHLSTDHSNKLRLINSIVDTVDKLNTLPYLSPFPISVTKNDLIACDIDSQIQLNQLHRCAVVASKFRNRWIYHNDPTFEFVPYDNEEFLYLINRLNQGIHELENIVSTPNRKKFNHVIHTLEVRVDASQYTDVTIYYDDVDLQIPREYQSDLRLSGHDVWIKKDLLGKDYITAFADHDDPNEFDVQPPFLTSGGLHIDLNCGRDALYQSQEFAAWLGQTPTDYHGNYPLGDVVAGRENISGRTKIVEFLGVRGGI